MLTCLFFLIFLLQTIGELVINWELSSCGYLLEYGISSGCIISIKNENDENNMYPIIYIFGGTNNNINGLNKVFKWDLNKSDEFIEVSSTIIPSQIVCHESITYNIYNNIIYIIGASQSPLSYGNIYEFNLISHKFEISDIASMPIPIRSSCVEMDNINNLLYSIGGLNSNEMVIDELQIFNIDTNKWINKLYIESIPIPIASSSCWLSLIGTKLYTFGGKSVANRILNDIYKYNIITNSWSYIGNLTKPKIGTKAIYINDLNKIVIIGGYTKNGYVGDIEIFDVINEGNTMLNGYIKTNIANQYRGYLMPIYIKSTLQIFVWGIYGINGYLSHPLKSNQITLLPTNNPTKYTMNPSIAPTINIINNPSNPEQIINVNNNNNNNNNKNVLEIETILLIAVITLIIFCFGIIAMIYIKMGTKSKSKLKDKRSRIATESCIDTDIDNDDNNNNNNNIDNGQCPDIQNGNNLSVDDMIRVASNSHNERERIQSIQSPNSIDLAIETDVNIVHVIANNNNDNNNNNDIINGNIDCMDDIDVGSMKSLYIDDDDNETVCARRGSIGTMTMMTQTTSILAHIDESEQEMDEQKASKIQMQIIPIHTNNMANHEMAEGFHHIHHNISDDDDDDDKFNEIDSEDSNFEIDRAGTMSMVSISEVQYEGLSAKRRLKKKKKKKKKKKRDKYKHHHKHKNQLKENDNLNEF